MTMILTVKGMTCEGCESVVETAIELADNVESASADRYENTVEVEGEDLEIDAVATKVELAGYRPVIDDGEENETEEADTEETPAKQPEEEEEAEEATESLEEEAEEEKEA